MKPIEILAEETTPDGAPVALWRRDGRYQIMLDGLELMSSFTHGSEEVMVRQATEALRGRPMRHVLVGGLGMGYTLRAALDAAPAHARVEVAEALPQIVEWNRGFLADLAGRPLDDPRTVLREGDIWNVLEPGSRPFDAILLDVDNGPSAFTLQANARLYDRTGTERLRSALRPGGVLAVWSSYEDPRYERTLHKAGFRARAVRVTARACGKGPRNTIFLAVRAEDRRRRRSGGRGRPG